MTSNGLVALAVAFATTAIVSFGGISTMIPEIHRQAVEVYGWMNDSQFATTFAIAQLAPGPNVLLMSLIGWRVAGGLGLFVATASTLVPTSLVALGAGRMDARLARGRWYSAMRRSFPPIVVGLIFASSLVTARVAIHGVVGICIAVGVAAFVSIARANPLIPLACAIAVGILAGRLGVF